MLRKIYNNFRNKLNDKQKIRLSKIVFSLTDKPFYDPSNKIELEKGQIIISADFELAWAWRYSKRKVNPIEMAKRERENVPLILNKLNELEIPITWATVGHLFLDKCECKNGKAHFDMPRPNYFENEHWKFDSGDWFDIDPCADYKRNPEFYAPDLIEMILKSKVNHEIACHSFSHIDYSDTVSSDEVVESDLKACEEAAKKFGLKLKSFVFPGNFHGHFNLLEKYGYEVIRYKSNEYKEIGYPEPISEKMIAIHDSLAFDLAEDGWDYNYLLWKLKKYVQKAIEKKAIVHFWFHPSVSIEEINTLIFPTLSFISEQREKGKIDFKCMQDLISIFK